MDGHRIYLMAIIVRVEIARHRVGRCTRESKQFDALKGDVARMPN